MRDAATGSAANGAQRLVSLDVLRSRFRVAFDLDRTERKVDPGPADATAERAVASGGNLGLGRQGHSNRAAVARACVHRSSPVYSVVELLRRLFRRLTFDLSGPP